MCPSQQLSESPELIEERRPYDSPQLQCFGDLSALTQSGGAVTGDAEQGSWLDNGR